MNIRKIKRSEEAVVGIVVAVLLAGLLFAVMTIIQMVYVPKWMEQKEAEHMDSVVEQFAQLKTAIDTQSALQQKNTPIATSITLGSGELPYLMSVRAYGELEVRGNACKIELTDGLGNVLNSFSVGIIRYSSANAYFINQEFIYETGAVITNQQEGNMMSIKPQFSIEKNPNLNISLTIINISEVGGKIASGGYGTIAIQTEYNDSLTSVNYTNVKNLNISTSYVNAWETFLNSTLKKTMTYGETNDFSIQTYINNNGYINISFANPITVYLKRIDILAQIGPGWIE